jgi:tRNA (guanine37-N1)-methyltransferase
MRFDVVTIFPRLFRGVFTDGVVSRAIAGGRIRVGLHNLRTFADDKRGTVDDTPYGGGCGMVLKPEPIFRAVETIRRDHPAEGKEKTILLTPSGSLFNQEKARALADFDRLILICGRYEGVDERVSESLADMELSIGDYVLSGGELAALVVIDAVSRAIPGVLGNEDSFHQDSFIDHLLDFPQYTKPSEFRGMKVPDVLLSGHHEKIRAWRTRMAEKKTARIRPDLWIRKKKNPAAFYPGQ